MQIANQTPHMGSATYAAKRAAAIISIVQDSELLDNTEILARLNLCLKEYGEKGSIKADDLPELKSVVHRLYDVFATGNTGQAATLLNAILTDHAQAPRLTNHGNSCWHLHVDSNDHATWAEWLAASSALALATLLAEKQFNPGGICASTSCKRPFIDLGMGGGRAYCSSRCASRERVATYRKAKKGHQQTPSSKRHI